jgi:ATP-dependent Clp protease ATP-binding subunit ClpC
MFERFTDRSRRVIVLAQEEARLLNHNYIGTEHLLLGMLAEKDGKAARVLESLDVTLTAAREEVRQIVGAGSGSQQGHIPFTPRAKKVLELSLREALTLGSQSIGSVHLLLGLIAEGEGVGAQIIVRLGVPLLTVRERATALAGSEPDPAPGLGETILSTRAGRIRIEGLGAIHELLTTIDNRLSRIEAHLGIVPFAAEVKAPAEEAGADPSTAGESSGDKPAAE